MGANEPLDVYAGKIRSVPEKFIQIVAAIKQFADLNTMPFQEAVGRLKAFEECTKKQTTEEDMSSRLLFLEADKKLKDKHQRCEHCGCGNSNHGDFRQGQGKGQESRKGQGDSGVQRDKSHIRCHKCHELGHYRNECPKSEKKEKANLTQYEDDEIIIGAPLLIRETGPVESNRITETYGLGTLNDPSMISGVEEYLADPAVQATTGQNRPDPDKTLSVVCGLCAYSFYATFLRRKNSSSHVSEIGRQEQPIPPVPVALGGQQVAFEILKAHNAWIKGSKEIVGLMIMKRLGHPVTLGLGVSLILIGLRKEYDRFVQKYNMHSMGKTVNELHAMLKLHEQTLTLPKSNAPALHAIRAAELMKKKKKKNAASGVGGSGIFIIELNTILNRSWIYDTGCGTHICNTTQGLRASRKLKLGALSLYVGNGQREAVEAIGAFYLCLLSGLEIVLNNCHYAPSITRGVISVSRLYEDGFVNHLMDNTIQVYRNNVVYFSAVPRDDQEASGSLEDLEIIQEEDTHPSLDTSLNHEEDDLEIDEPQSDIVPIRRSTMTRYAPDRMCLYIDAEEHELGDLGEPANYKAALLDLESKQWLNAMNVEMQSMKDNEV
uniref:Zinc finger, CCHC-type n=1 Tax=Tanacetum cinerariifolium TaxID=118510 RepID=A0A6L2JNI7_TANCI|nr:zinc finger, CCHC-type [Tanacetum cinerariifolium]